MGGSASAPCDAADVLAPRLLSGAPLWARNFTGWQQCRVWSVSMTAFGWRVLPLRVEGV